MSHESHWLCDSSKGNFSYCSQHLSEVRKRLTIVLGSIFVFESSAANDAYGVRNSHLIALTKDIEC